MSDGTGIEWTRGDDGRPGATWNPVTGCDRVSKGCDHCYALTLAERFRGTPGHYFEHGFDVVLRPDKLDQPLRWKRPRRIFVNSMSDLFHKDVPDAYIAQVFAVMALAPQHTFQLLTKRHGRMRSLLNDDRFIRSVWYTRWKGSARRSEPPDVTVWPLPNVHLGVSVEDQDTANLRIPALLATPAAVRWLSMEPLIGPVSFRWSPWVNLGTSPGDRTWHLDGLKGIDWVVVGGESGRGARPMHPQWARDIRDQCAAAEVPFFFKQAGEFACRGRCRRPAGGTGPA